MSTINPRSLRDEADLLPETLGELAALQQALLEAGETVPVVNGIIGWLLAKRFGIPDGTAQTTRSRYRKILRGHLEAGRLGGSPRSGCHAVSL